MQPVPVKMESGTASRRFSTAGAAEAVRARARRVGRVNCMIADWLVRVGGLVWLVGVEGKMLMICWW